MPSRCRSSMISRAQRRGADQAAEGRAGSHRDREASRHRPQRCGIVRSAWARRHTLDAMVFGLQPLPPSATRAQRNCDGVARLRDGCATEWHACATDARRSGTLARRMRDGAARLRDGCATERPTRDTMRDGFGTPCATDGARLRYACATASTTPPGVSERLRCVRYAPGKGPIIRLLGPHFVAGWRALWPRQAQASQHANANLACDAAD